jgi:hypothetical protein
MELLDEGLNRWMKQPPKDGAAPRRPIQAIEAAQIALQVFRGLVHVHAADLVHRDIKPQNILLKFKPSTTELERVKIADFGVAKSFNRRTRLVSFAGTWNYMSPEMVRLGPYSHEARSGEIDHRTDIYSAGVTLYELVTARQAFPGAGRDVQQKILAADVVHVADANPDVEVPRPLADIVMRAMHPDQRRRYETAAEVERELVAFLDEADAGRWLDRASSAAPAERERMLRQLIRRRPELLEAYERLGALQAQHGRIADACATYRLALMRHPGAARVHLQLGRLLKPGGRPGEARDHLTRAIEAGLDTAETELARTLLQQLGDVKSPAGSRR